MKTAFTESVPTGRDVVDVDAAPLVTVAGLPISVGVPVPYSNWTVPVAADGLTVALSVTEVPNGLGTGGRNGQPGRGRCAGRRCERSGVLVELAYPLPLVGVKTAASGSVPTGSDVVDVDAAPLVTVTGLPIRVGVPVPYSNWTDPCRRRV